MDITVSKERRNRRLSTRAAGRKLADLLVARRTLKDVGKILGVSIQTVANEEATALGKVQVRMRELEVGT